MNTLQLSGFSLAALLAVGLIITLLGARREELTIRETLAGFLRGQAEAYGPPQVSGSRFLLLFLGCLAAGLAFGLALLPIHRTAALLAGFLPPVAGLIGIRRLSGSQEKAEAGEDVLPLVAHLRQMLGRGAPIREALSAFAQEVEPGRALARRVEGCLAAAELGVDVHQAFEAWVARDDRHLQALGSLLREVERSPEPQTTLDRLARKILADLRREKRFQVKRQALASIMATVLGLFPPLMLALLEPAAYRLIQGVLGAGLM